MPHTPSPKIMFVETNDDGTVGGSYFCLLELIKRLNTDGFSHEVVFYREHSLLGEFQKLGPVTILRLPPPLDLVDFTLKKFGNFAALRMLASSVQKLINVCRRDLLLALRAFKAIRRSRANVVHLNNGPAFTSWLLAAKACRVPCVAHLRGLWNSSVSTDLLLGGYDAVICISKVVSSSLAKARGAPKRERLIYDGIDFTQVRENALREPAISLPVSSQDINVFCVVGNIKQWKGQHVAIEALKYLKNIEPRICCILMGSVAEFEVDRAYGARIDNLIQEHNLQDRVFRVGFISNPLPIVSKCFALVHTSVEPEPLGRSMLEAMCLEVPVIASATGGPLEILTDQESGLLVPPGDSEALANALLKLSADPGLRDKLTRNAKREVKSRFSIEQSVSLTRALYSELIVTPSQ